MHSMTCCELCVSPVQCQHIIWNFLPSPLVETAMSQTAWLLEPDTKPYHGHACGSSEAAPCGEALLNMMGGISELPSEPMSQLKDLMPSALKCRT